MSDTTQEQARWQFRAYHEDPDHYVARLLRETGQPPSPQPEPITVARQQLALAVRQDGFVIDLDSIREEESVNIVVNEQQTDYVLAVDGKPRSGRLVTWSATGHQRVGTDADDPVLEAVRESENDDGLTAIVPAPYATVGGSCRIRHGLGGEVTVTAFQPDGEGIGYLFATTLDPDTVHVEFFGGTARFYVVAD